MFYASKDDASTKFKPSQLHRVRASSRLCIMVDRKTETVKEFTYIEVQRAWLVQRLINGSAARCW